MDLSPSGFWVETGYSAYHLGSGDLSETGDQKDLASIYSGETGIHMITAVSYDIVDNRRRHRLSKLLERFGSRVQKSVFEMDLEDKELPRLIQKIEKLIDPSKDSVRIYRLDIQSVKLSVWIGQRIEVFEKGYYLFQKAVGNRFKQGIYAKGKQSLTSVSEEH